MVDRSFAEIAARNALKRLGTSLCDRYHIVRLIGLGGMSAVFAGTHRNGHPVAIKTLHGRFADAETDSHIRREARLANKIRHPVVVPVLDDDVTEDGCVFLVMPLLQGETLRARAARSGGKLPPTEVVSIAHAVLGALESAHGLGIVHRDLKPENIFATEEGAIRLLDFGIGRAFGPGLATLGSQAESAVGTPAFMAPEQALGRAKAIDGRTDLWGLGATMFTLLSGHVVHCGDGAAETTALAATRAARPIGEVAPHIPALLRQIVDRALRFDQDERWPDAASMRRALEGASEEAFGRPVADLPVLIVPREGTAEGIDARPTEHPPRHAGGVGPSLPEERAFTRRARSLAGLAGPAGVAALIAVGACGALLTAHHRAEPASTVASAAADTSSHDVRIKVARQLPADVMRVEISAPALPSAVAFVQRPPTPAPRPRRARAGDTPSPVDRAAAVSIKCDPPYNIDAEGHHVYKIECE